MAADHEKGRIEHGNSDSDLTLRPDQEHVGHDKAADMESQGQVPDPDLSTQKKILRKMDLRIIPMVTILYLLSFLDRGNIGNARVLGMEKDIGLINNQYSIALMVFFFPYALLEVPANLLLKKLKPSIWLPTIMLAWGAVTIGTGFVESFDHLVICRVFLGIAEAGQYPGCAYYLTLWYATEDLALRQGMFFSAASAAGAFSGLLAYGIDQMAGTANLEGWRWIFILEGIVTCGVGLAAFFWIQNSPATAKFLSPYEKTWVRNRLMRKTASGRYIQESEKFEWKYIVQGLFDWQIWCAIFINWGTACAIYGMSYFLPSIVNRLGYTGQEANLLTIPIYVVAATLTILLCWCSDRIKKRSIFVLCLLCFEALGYIFALAGSAIGGLEGLVYAGCFMSTACCYPAYVLTISWIIPNVAPSYKRAVATAILIGIGNLGGIFASNWYRAQDAPQYLLGHGMELMVVVLGFVAANVLRFNYRRINKARDQQHEAVANLTEDELAEMGDRAPSFRYGL